MLRGFVNAVAGFWIVVLSVLLMLSVTLVYGQDGLVHGVWGNIMYWGTMPTAAFGLVLMVIGLADFFYEAWERLGG